MQYIKKNSFKIFLFIITDLKHQIFSVSMKSVYSKLVLRKDTPLSILPARQEKFHGSWQSVIFDYE